MKTMGAYEAKVHWSQLLKDVEDGETVEITRNGKPIARLIGVPEFDPDDAERAAREWISYRDKRRTSLGDVTVRELIEEGRM